MGFTTKTYRVIWFLLVILLCLPLIQSFTNVIKSKPLHGAINKIKQEKFTWEGWFNESYQTNITPYLKEEVGFYPDFIRINNQIKYWLTKQVSAKGVIIGKNGYLYEANYIKAYLGTDFLGAEVIEKKVNAIASFRQQLNAKGKELVIILAPGKASYFPEFIAKENVPLDYPEKTNYIVYKKELNKLEVPTIDANEWFRSMKDTSQYPLFPKCGIHWSKYGEYLMADSLSKYLNTMFPECFPRLKLQEITWSKTNLDTDYDIGNGMNMIFQLPVFPMAYPTFHFSEPKHPKKKAIIVADSYYWGLHNAEVTKNFFDNGEFWYYNKEIHYVNGRAELPIDVSFSYSDAINHTDLVIMIATDANLYKFPYGFINQVEDLSNQKLKQLTNQYITKIKSSPEWLKNIGVKAKERGISLEEAIYRDALYLAKKRL